MTNTTPRRTTRGDGAKTRSLILNTAFRLFAEKGLRATTSKEICRVAGVNEASIKYHFGSRQNLYVEVAKAAHNKLLSFDELTEVSKLSVPPEEKLKITFYRLLRTSSHDESRLAIRFFMNEVINPSEILSEIVSINFLPKFSVFLQWTSEITGVPATSPSLRRVTGMVLMPVFIATMYPRALVSQLFALKSGADEEFVNEICQYALALLGSDALRKNARAQKYSPGTEPPAGIGAGRP